MPPLRERKEDLGPLARHLLEDIARRAHCAVPRLTLSHLETLHAYDWPGNVRELRNVLERATISARGDELRIAMPQGQNPRSPSPSWPAPPAQLSPDPRPSPPLANVHATFAARSNDAVLRADEIRQIDRENLLAALDRTGGKISRAPWRRRRAGAQAHHAGVETAQTEPPQSCSAPRGAQIVPEARELGRA